MFQNNSTPAREYAKGQGEAVADRTVNRKIFVAVSPYTVKQSLPRRDDLSLDHQVDEWCKSNGYKVSGYHVAAGDDKEVQLELNVTHVRQRETWADVAERVAEGNALLLSGRAGLGEMNAERDSMLHHLRQASILMSGRHLQHGDVSQPGRNMEVFTNCLDGSTRILTMEYGPIEIEKVANQIVTVIAGDGQPRSATINEHGEQELFDIVFRQNTTGPAPGNMPVVRATANHRWKLADGSITDALKVGDVIACPKAIVEHDPAAVVHGLIFGDGTAHKTRRDHVRPGVSQGRTYASIRVCKGDAVRDEIHRILDAAGYRYATPPHADGDRVYYVGKFAHAKELPFTNDPEYIAGFIYGWWLADGHKGVSHALEISTANADAAKWLTEHASYAGYVVTMNRVMEHKEGDGSFANGKPLNVIRIRQNLGMKVASITPVGKAKVYCPEEPVTSTFVLANGLLTGNCSTSAASFLLFYLLLNGSGVGRDYSDHMIQADLNYLPIVVLVIDMMHKDAQSGEITALTRRDAEHLYAGRVIHVFEVPDSREGWAKALEKMELMAFNRVFRDDVLILDFSGVRHRGSPIAGMQGRPASGPGPLMSAISNVAKLRDAGMAPWRAAMYADHYLAECVLVGGARRAARMATKYWKDKTVLDFVQLKRGGFLWSSNNSVLVDAEFWELVQADEAPEGKLFSWQHARAVFKALTEASYFDQTGEPGLINVDRLTWNAEGVEELLDGNFAESDKYKLEFETLELTRSLVQAWVAGDYQVITNPCGEIVLASIGGYCVIADVVPFHAAYQTRLNADQFSPQAVNHLWDQDAESAFRVATRALIRTNLMNSLYQKEVRRTNRIGVGMTGFHEYAWARFGYGWKDMVNEEKSKDFWLMVARFKRAVQDEARAYSEKLGVNVPHTNTTFKPAGTTSKLFGLTEGAHLPSMREYLRWVQFRNDDPLVDEYREKGYPIRKLQTYNGTTIVGFPTAPLICQLGMGEALVTAAEATPEEQYQYLRLIEKYWIVGVEEDGVTPLEDRGNQVSYTLKYDPKVVGFEEFRRTLLEGQSDIRCCSVMPQADTSAYEYQPEQPVTKHEFEMIAAAIQQSEIKEEIGLEHVDCSSGACPIDFRTEDEQA